MTTLRYSIVTPVRDEVDNLNRLFACVCAQRRLPYEWVIVDTGSADGSAELARRFSATHDWIATAITLEPLARGGPIVRAFEFGVDRLTDCYDIVVKLDADVSFDEHYFDALVRRFEEDSHLGIASGTCFELANGTWRQRHVTGAHVWGASRAYRVDCLRAVRPLEERMGWDGIDAFKANAAGWRTQTFLDLPFRHHRPEAGRESAPLRVWYERGRHVHYMAYRPSFVIFRALFHVRRDIRALALVAGWIEAAVRRRPQSPATEARAVVRRQQRLRELPARAREALGRRATRSAAHN